MKTTIVLPAGLPQQLRAHLFQNELEQGAFLYARPQIDADGVCLEVAEAFFVPPEGWAIQTEVHLEMKNEMRAKIMQQAWAGDFAAIDCHSHPHANGQVWFSPSDKWGITDFAAYAKWRLGGKPFAAIVWGWSSADAVVWHGDFTAPQRVDRILVGSIKSVLRPRGTWFRPQPSYWGGKSYGR
jgi:hypothetical protein